MSGEVKDFIKTKEILVNDWIKGENAAGPMLSNVAATATVPTILPNKSLTANGLSAIGNFTNIISGSAIGLSCQWRASGDTTLDVNSNVGLTAAGGSSQGDGPITSSFNVYDTVSVAGDAATLPATFLAGTIIFIKNGAAANSMDVFPASGDDLGAGANTQRALAAKDFAVYIGTTANATWEELMRGTCSA